MNKKIGIALLLLYSDCVFAVNPAKVADSVVTKYSGDLKVVSWSIPCRYRDIIIDNNATDVENVFGLEIFDNVDEVLSELIAEGISKSIRYLSISYGMTSSSFKKLIGFDCVEYLVLRKCFLSSSDLFWIPSCVKFLDLSECLPISGKLDTLNLSSLRSNSQLQLLSLAGTTLGQKDIADLSLLDSLKYLDLSCSNFTASAYKMKFPNTKLSIIDDRDAADVYGGDIS